MKRRDFLRTTSLVAAALAARHLHAQDTLTATLTIDDTTKLATIPADYIGLSYESAQLANPAFFAPQNKQLIAIFRELGTQGVLRIGGGTSEFTTYSAADPTTPPPFEVFGPDTSHTGKSDTTTTALALRNLRAFLDATGWSCIYGLNLGQGTKENAATEAVAVVHILGSRLLALQIGNEPDSFRNRYRPAAWGPSDYIVEWNAFHEAVVSALTSAGLAAKFAGPDISNKLPFLTAFAAEAPQHPDIIFLTGHYYAMGPAGNPEATLANMLLPDPKLTTLKQHDIPIVLDAMNTAHLPFRISEMNSCWNGGQPGASDTFASALWCADAMLRFAALGFSGVNLHGGGNGIYSPIVGSPTRGFTRRPEFFGMQFAQQFAGWNLLPSTLETPDVRLTAYVFEQGTTRKLALINKTAQTATCHLPMAGERSSWTGEPLLELSAPTIDAKSGVRLRTLAKSGSGTPATLAPYTARIYRLLPFAVKGGGPMPRPRATSSL